MISFQRVEMNLRSTLRAAIGTLLIGLACAAPRAMAADSAPGAYSGPKKTVFVDVVAAAETMNGGLQAAGTTNEGLNAMLVEALIASDRFIVLERVALGDIQLEQELGKNGATSAATAAVPGRMLGASAIVLATVTKFGAATSGSGVQLGIPFGRLLGAAAGVNGQDSMVEFSLRIIDTSSGQVIAISKASGNASSSNATVSAFNQKSGATASASTFRNTPLGTAAERAIGAAVQQIIRGMEKLPWSASVIAFDDGKVYLSAGAAHNIRPGMTLHVYRKGKVLTDPGTGVVLEVLMTKVGTLQIQSASDKTSIAIMISGEPPARGDIVTFG
jgi:curli biogenesis system outer membrane secretion channel CsgG